MTLRAILLCALAAQALFCGALPAQAGSSRLVTVMAPLLMSNDGEWNHFRESLKEAKKAGIDAVTTDVWWGVVQADGPASFKWGYYHRMVAEIRAAGLKWIPILSTHACGGNVGDTVNIPIPKWVWTSGRSNGRSIRFKSEGRNESDEYVSYWDTAKVLDAYKGFYAGFRDEFKSDADLVPEIIMSMGAAGELHYPSYNSHDRNLPYAGYPHRGALQASSDSAQESFRAAMFAKYGSLAGINKAWGGSFGSADDIRPPTTTSEVDHLLADQTMFSAYGQDLFDWYRGSMLDHAKLLGGEAMKIFGTGAFSRAAMGFKIPGVHWSMENRQAELTSGLLSTRQPTAGNEWEHKHLGMGYREIFETMRALQKAHPNQPVDVYFTAGMTPNGNDAGMGERSRAEDLLRGFAAMGKEYHLRIGLENALDSDLVKPEHVEILKRALQEMGYSSVSLLRVDDVLASGVLRRAIQEIHTFSPLKDCERALTLYPESL